MRIKQFVHFNTTSGFSQALFLLFIPFKTTMRNYSYREVTRWHENYDPDFV